MSKQSCLKGLALFCCFIFLLFHAGVVAQPALQEQLTPAEKRGKQIFVTGTSQSGREILAYLGEAALEVPATAMTCAGCHGLDGQGKPEGGVTPSILTWEALTRPYGVRHAGGRRHPPYTERGLELAIARGVDPGGNKLLNVMPRYQMSGADMADLIAYLKRLGKDRDPGISESKIVIGTIVPAGGALAEMGQAVKAVINAYFSEVNGQGGIYNRRVELKSVETAGTPVATRSNVERFLQDEQVFATTGAFIAGAESELTALMEQKEVPMVGPITLYTPGGFPLNRQVFYLLSGFEGQSRALVVFAGRNRQLKHPGLAVVVPQSLTNLSAVEAIKDQTKKDGWKAPETYIYPAAQTGAAAGVVAQIQKSGPEAIIFLGTGAAALAFMQEAEKLRWFPSLYLPAGSVGKELFDAPSGFDRKIFISFPTLPTDQTPDGAKEFLALTEKHKLSAQHRVAQFSAYSAAKVLVEALKLAGQEVSREKLIAALEGFNRFETGLTPAITYGPNRRVGAFGAYMVSIDLAEKRFAPASAWVEIE